MPAPLDHQFHVRVSSEVMDRVAKLTAHEQQHARVGTVTDSDVKREIISRGLLQMEQARRAGGKG